MDKLRDAGATDSIRQRREIQVNARHYEEKHGYYLAYTFKIFLHYSKSPVYCFLFVYCENLKITLYIENVIPTYVTTRILKKLNYKII